MTWFILIAVNFNVMVYGSALDCNTAAFRSHIPIGQYECVPVSQSELAKQAK